MTRFARPLLLVLIAASAFIASCQIDPLTGKNTLNLYSYEDEKQMGDESVQPIIAELGGLYPDQATQQYVDRVGQKVVVAGRSRLKGEANFPDWDFHFYVVNTSMINAFALPGGHVFVSLELTDKCTARPQSSTPRSNAQVARHGRNRWHRAHAVLRVTDNGVGMDASVLGRVFQPGFSRKLRGKGSGLGMSIVADIVHDHGGDITVESSFGRGTEVIIRIPLARIAESDPRHD